MFISYTFAMKIYLVRKNLLSCNCIDKTCDSGSRQRQGVKNYSLLSLIQIDWLWWITKFEYAA